MAAIFSDPGMVEEDTLIPVLQTREQWERAQQLSPGPP